ncbi:hypothetical protein RUM44_011803 [Polyplax serrata]|uniref:Uncharacterized protein n=1 Tax=Polyplax serrata TaxID=468196 RepID=A0ABR1AR43_POLSC
MVPELIGQQCASEFSVDWSQILECANSIMGSTLLSEYGQMTDSLNPKMTFVPTVLLNQKYGNQAAILKDFFKEICAVLNDKPNECN